MGMIYLRHSFQVKEFDSLVEIHRLPENFFFKISLTNGDH
jgi:hypothetical protein